ncbi:MAG: hypothetical protein ACK5XV_00565 [Flavobacteriales bacterium]
MIQPLIRHLRILSLSAALLLAGTWGLRWEHAWHGHDHHHARAHDHYHHSHGEEERDRGHGDCELCKWAVAWFVAESPLTWSPFNRPESWLIHTHYASPMGIAPAHNADPRGPPTVG